jgi:hydroxymethylbilane synthase
MNRTIVIGSRGSSLALVQAEQVRSLFISTFTDIDVVVKTIKTEGDQDTDKPLAEFGGRGVFVTALEDALEKGEIDVAVHSLKDLPSRLSSGFSLGAVPYREDPRDVIITRGGITFEQLPKGAMIGTGSLRRRIQLSRLRSDLAFEDIRGNIDTRLGKLDDGKYDAIVLAAAGLHRLGKKDAITAYFDVDKMIPAPCQGAIGIEYRTTRSDLAHALKSVEQPEIRACVDAERVFIGTLEMGCHAPVAAFALIGRGGAYFRAIAGANDGSVIQKSIQTSKGMLLKTVRDLAIQFRMSLNKLNR